MNVIPHVSVVMSVRNDERHVGKAIESVLDQTLNEFELIIVNDGSTDSTPQIIDAAAETDLRVRVIHRPQHGLSESLNFGVSQARSELVARMDPADVCLPERLELQAAYMHSRPEVGLLGAGVFFCDDDGADRGWWTPATDHETIRETMIRSNQFVDSTVVFRKSAFESLGGYGPLRYSQDYDLWLRMAAADRVENLAQPLLVRRITADQLDPVRVTEESRLAWRARKDAIERGDYPRSALLRLWKPALAAATPAPVRRATRRILHPLAAA